MMHNSSAVQDTILPVTKSFVVKLPIAAAFRLFTSEIGRWWPLSTHSVFGEAAKTCAVDEQVGGRIYEVHADGRQAEWGQILSWEPPYLFACSWYPGRTPDSAQELKVTFQTEADGTRVTLVHVGWERLGERAAASRMGYEEGWDTVLKGYTELAVLR
jgi:uncharacterized protein YndB with AHSA1/START domain